MSIVDLAGECELCGQFTTSLRYRPDRDEEGRPSVCYDCYADLEEGPRA